MDFDVIVVGSGFGGSVAALRLAEKGYRVAVIEAGRRFDAASLPRTSWDITHYLWAPRLGCFGVQRVHLLSGALVLAGAGVGGGSLNYANTLYEPLGAFFEDPQWVGPSWGGDPGWRSLLAPYYAVAKSMLGAVRNPRVTPADEAMRRVALAMGVAESFEMAPVGVFFGPPGARPGTAYPDPYFAGAGPPRRSCSHCGECMTGCRRGAKNTLVTNYLYLAERAGAVVVPMTTVVALEPLGAPDGSRGWGVFSVPTRWLWARGLGRPRLLRAEHVVLAAGTYGTQQLLHSMALSGRLPRLSQRLGCLTRTNSESLVGATVPFAARAPGPGLLAEAGVPSPAVPRAKWQPPDFSEGVAITSAFRPDPRTSIEPVRYGHGSNLMGLFGTLLVPPTQEGATEGPGTGAGGAGSGPAGVALGRPASKGGSLRHLGLKALARDAARGPKGFLSFFDLRRWSERTVIALVMQSLDNSLTVRPERGLFGGVRLSSSAGEGASTPAWLPVAHEVARRLAEAVGGRPARTWAEVFGLPMTAHFLGGCAIGASPAEGVVDPWHRVYGYQGLHIVDGSAVPANPGTNPALTITAMAERAFSHWPNRGEGDPRPPVGEVADLARALRRTAAVAPNWPVAAVPGPI